MRIRLETVHVYEISRNKISDTYIIKKYIYKKIPLSSNNNNNLMVLFLL